MVTSLGATVMAYSQLPGGWFRNNAGWITGNEQTVLVDTCATEGRSRRLLDAVHAHTGREPATAVITHAHGDHANGARLVARAGGAILASPTTTAQIQAGPNTYPTVFHCTTWGDITPPDTIEGVTDRRSIDLGGQSVEVVPVPCRAHTDGDLVVWADQDGVLFTGDLLFNQVTPLTISGSVVGWLDALDWLGQFDARHVVPGHGPLLNPDEAISAVRGYLRWLVDVVTDVGNPDFTALHHQARTRWPHWLDGERHIANLHIAHAQTHGLVPDLNTALTAMLTMTGGMIRLDL